MPTSLRPFVGAKDYAASRAFYRAWGFSERIISADMCLLSQGGIAFYLQDAYVRDWVDNTMLFWEVEDLAAHYAATVGLELPVHHRGARVSELVDREWGGEYFVHDVSGVLWHVGSFT